MKMMRKQWFATCAGWAALAAVLTLTAGCPLCQSEDVSSVLAEICNKSGVPGMVAVLIDENGKVLAQGAYGVRVRCGSDAVDFADVFHIGSCTKSMTGTLCGILKDDPKVDLDWDSLLKDIVPADFPQTFPAGFEKITLRHLLNHTSGFSDAESLPEDTSDSAMYAYEQDVTAGRWELLRLALRGHLAWDPDENHFSYSNMGLTFAGMMATCAYNKAYSTNLTYEELLTKLYFEPLGMTTAGFGTPGSDNTRDRYMPDPPYTVPQGHHSPDDPAEPNQPIGMGALSDNPLVIGPAGTAHMNVSDMTQHLLLHMGNGAKLRAAHLSRETLDMLHQKQVDIESASGPVGYAFGWGVRASDPYLGHPVLTHNGSNGSWNATMWIDTQLGRAVAVLNNQGGDKAGEANLAVIERLLKMP